MEDKKVDRRSLKTQRQIKEALCELLTIKELRHITIQEISDKADIHRVTFYKHYYDIYNLYDVLVDDIFSQLEVLIQHFHENPSYEFGAEVIGFIEDNPKIFKMIFSPFNTGELKQKFSSMIEGGFRYIQTNKKGVDFSNDRLDYLSACWASICIGVIEKWVKNDFAQSKDFINNTLIELDKYIEQSMNTTTQ